MTIDDMDNVPYIAPHSLEVERAVLCALLLDKANLPKVAEVLQPTDFYKEGHRKIFATMLSLFERSEPVDLLTVTEELRRAGELDEVGGAAALAALVEEAATTLHFATYAKIVRDHAVKRHLIQFSRALETAAQNGRSTAELLDLLDQERLELRPTEPNRPEWPLHDGADEWNFPAIEELIEDLLPASGIVWWGGLPKRFKSLLALYISLGIACRRTSIAKKFLIRAFRKILYVAREDGGSRLKDRRRDILSAWKERPEAGAIKFVIRPRLDLMDPKHIGWLRETCLREGIGMLVLDTWTALSPSADPLGAKDQAQLAAAIMQLCEDINGLVIVVDHSRKNRPDGAPLSSAEIFGPPQKWAAAEHIVMLDLTADGRRLEVFLEGKDLETRRFLLTVSPRGSGEEKFAYAGTIDELADAQRAVGDQHREAILQIVQKSDGPLAPAEVAARLHTTGINLKEDTIQKHLRALLEAKKIRATGQTRQRRYFGLDFSPEGPSSGKPVGRE